MTDFVSTWNKDSFLTYPVGPLGLIAMPGTEEIGIPVCEFRNNATWAVVKVADTEESFGILLKDTYGNGQMWTLAVPDSFPDFYKMPGRVLTRIRQLFPKAAVIFATTTPVIEEQARWAYRSNAEIDAYNKIAREVLVPRGVRINELGDFAAKECAALHRDWVHYNDEGSGKLADEIIRFLEQENLI